MKAEITGAEAGLSGDKQITIALEAIDANGGQANMQTLYQAVESCMNGQQLSEQGRASLRRLVNFNAVQAGFLYAYDKANPGWRITPEGRDFLLASQHPEPPEEVINVDTQHVELLASNTVRGAAFERYVETLLKLMYPCYAWYDQGRYKRKERG